MAYQRSLLQLALAASLTVKTCAWIPPHPDSDLAATWEPVHQMRRRLELPFNYTTSKYMHPETCRFLTETECQEADVMMQKVSKGGSTRSWRLDMAEYLFLPDVDT